MEDALEAALNVPGFETKRDARRVVFTRTDEMPPMVVMWSISGDELRALVAQRGVSARSAMGSSQARGEWLLGVHVQEALLTFSGERGEMFVEATGIAVRSLK